MESQGLGDTIAKVTSFFGIDKVADAVAKMAGLQGCGCKERKEYLNHLFPYENFARDFEVIKPFTYLEKDYVQGELIQVTKNSPIFGALVHYVRDGFLQEI